MNSETEKESKAAQGRVDFIFSFFTRGRAAIEKRDFLISRRIGKHGARV